MNENNFLKDRDIFFVIFGIIVGILLLYTERIYFLIIFLVCILLFCRYLFLKPFATILKCMLCVIFFIPFQYFDFLNFLRIINPLTVLGLVLAAKLIFCGAPRNQEKIIQITVIDRLYLVFLIAALISSLRAISLLGAFNWIFYSAITGYVVYRAILTLKQEEVMGILKFLVLLGFLSALYGIGEFLIGYSVIFGQSASGRLTSLIGHPLLNGMIFSAVFPICLFLFIQTKKKSYILGSIVFFMAIILTFARGSWFALLASIVMIGIFFPNKRNIRMPLIVLTFVVILMAIPATNRMITNRVTTNEHNRYSSFNIRIKSIPIAMDIIQDRPFFGGGPFNAGRYKEKYSFDSTLQTASYENAYLGLLIDVGFAGVSLLVLICFFAFKNSLFSRARNGQNSLYKIAVGSSLLILLINMATFNFDSYRVFHFITWFFISLNYISFKIRDEDAVGYL